MSRGGGIVLLVVLGVVGWVGPSPAIDLDCRFSGDLQFLVDAASFPGSGHGSQTVLFVEVPASSLRFPGAKQGKQGGDLRVSAVFRDRKGRPIAARTQVYAAAEFARKTATGETIPFLKMLQFRLPTGDMQAEIQLEETGTGRVGGARFRLRVPDFKRGFPAVSNLVFGSCGTAARGTSARERWGPVFPHPGRRYGREAPVPCVYALVTDTAQAAPDTAYRVLYKVKDSAGRTREKKRITVPRRGRRGEVLIRPRIAGYALGQYRITVEVALEDGKAERAGTFYVDETQISFTENADMIATVLGYVATNQELIELEKAPAESLKGVFDRFWARRDPTPGTPRNEALTKFLRRVDYATRHFGVLEPGWRSDRGRIYIKYGPPDRVQEIPNRRNAYPTVIWRYISRNATFVFRDHGFGRYRLAGTHRE